MIIPSIPTLTPRGATIGARSSTQDSNTVDPEYLKKRATNNLAAKKSRAKKKEKFKELEEKCQKKKEKIQCLKAELKRKTDRCEQLERNLKHVTCMYQQAVAQQKTIDSDDVRVIASGPVAMPSSAGFGIERSQDFAGTRGNGGVNLGMN